MSKKEEKKRKIEWKRHCFAISLAANPKNMSKKDTETIKFKKIDKIDTAACVMHKGPYSTLGEAYSAVYKWIEENNYIPCDNPRESYIDGIWNKEDPEEWLTEIQVPIVSKNNL